MLNFEGICHLSKIYKKKQSFYIEGSLMNTEDISECLNFDQIFRKKTLDMMIYIHYCIKFLLNNSDRLWQKNKLSMELGILCTVHS